MSIELPNGVAGSRQETNRKATVTIEVDLETQDCVTKVQNCKPEFALAVVELGRIAVQTFKQQVDQQRAQQQFAAAMQENAIRSKIGLS